MAEIARLDGHSDAIQLDFVKSIETPILIIKLAIHLHLVGLSLRKTVVFLENFSVNRCHPTVHYSVKKSDLELKRDRSPEKIALDETIAKIEGEQH